MKSIDDAIFLKVAVFRQVSQLRITYRIKYSFSLEKLSETLFNSVLYSFF